MRAHRLAVAAFGLSFGLLAAEKPEASVSVTQTQHVEFPAGGVLHVQKSVGILTVEGWDRADMEITTTKAPAPEYDSEWRPRPARPHELDGVRITAERNGNQVIVATTLPRGTRFRPFRDSAVVDCRIRIPRGAGLVVEHEGGEVNAAELTGDIRVVAHHSQINLHLPEEGQYAIDARSRFGTVISDFPGSPRRRVWLVGHRWVSGENAGAHKLFLRTGSGDILILKTRIPGAAASN